VAVSAAELSIGARSLWDLDARKVWLACATTPDLSIGARSLWDFDKKLAWERQPREPVSMEARSPWDFDALWP
jgi:hypothetical protein